MCNLESSPKLRHPLVQGPLVNAVRVVLGQMHVPSQPPCSRARIACCLPIHLQVAREKGGHAANFSRTPKICPACSSDMPLLWPTSVRYQPFHAVQRFVAAPACTDSLYDNRHTCTACGAFLWWCSGVRKAPGQGPSRRSKPNLIEGLCRPGQGRRSGLTTLQGPLF